LNSTGVTVATLFGSVGDGVTVTTGGAEYVSVKTFLFKITAR